VIIDAAPLADIVTHAREQQPLECCGMLIGGAGRISGSVRARNLAGSPTRYLIHPEDHIRARRDARTHGMEVVGFYHSHPRSPAVPSPSDLAEASYSGCVWLIVSLLGEGELRLFTIERGQASEIESGELSGARLQLNRRGG
jgi:proteasome lid subunit RPN8/RPN11